MDERCKRLSILKLFRNKNKDDNEKLDRSAESKIAEKISKPENTVYEAEENEDEIIAVISAAISAFLKKPVSGFRVVSFKKRGNWKTINNL